MKIKLLILDFGDSFALSEREFEIDYETEKMIFCVGYKIPKDKIGKICHVNGFPSQRFIAQLEDSYDKKKLIDQLVAHAMELYSEKCQKREQAAETALNELKDVKTKQAKFLENVKKTLNELEQE